MKKMLGALALSAGLVVFSSCENIPLGAYSLATDSLPARAQVVTEAQYSELQKSSLFHSLMYQSIGEEQQAAAREEAENQQVIDKFRAAHPDVGTLLPTLPREAGVTFNADGTYTHQVRLNDGRKISVHTLGQRWAKAALRHTIDVFPTRQNQLSFYQMLYSAMSESVRAELQLPTPETLEADDKLYSADKIHALNDQISAKLAEATPAPAASAFSFVAPACSNEEGVASGSDRSGNRDDDPACAPQPTGIYSHYDWPSKPYLTCVKDQGSRGTCVSFAIASTLESLVARHDNRYVNVSEQYIYQQGKLFGIREDFDDGLNEWITLWGMTGWHWKIPFESAWEYNPSPNRQTNSSAHLYTHSCDGYSGNCSDSSHQMPVFCSNKGKFRYCGFMAQAEPEQGFGLKGYSELWNLLSHGAGLKSMIAALNVGRPVILSFNVTPSWDAATSDGFVTYNGSGEKNRGGHAVHAVGAIDNATLAQVLPSAPAGSGGGYLIIKNSWTNCWADGGFVYVPYDYVRAYTSSAIAVTN